MIAHETIAPVRWPLQAVAGLGPRQPGRTDK
jgi:hypothetical protein